MGRGDNQEAIRAAVATAELSSGLNYVRIDCPLCLGRTGKPDRRRSFSFSVKHGSYKCFKCRARGRLHGWGFDGDFDEDTDDEAEPVVNNVEPPKGWTPLWDAKAIATDIAKPALAYAEKRCPRELWQQLQVGACLLEGPGCDFYGRVVVPVTDSNGGWVGWVGRAWVDRHPLPYKNMSGRWAGDVVYNPNALHTHSSSPIIVVEGVFDAIHVWPHGVAVMGKPSPRQVAQLVRARRDVAVLLDGDAWAEGWALMQDLRLEGLKAGAIRLPPRKDPDDYPAATILEWAKECLESEDEYKP